MRIMTYNIRLGIQLGLAPIVQTINLADADVVALQEVGKDWIMGPYEDTAKVLATETGLVHYNYAPTIEMPGKNGASNPAFYGHALLSRWPIVESEIIDLPQIEDEPRCLLITTIAAPTGRLKILSTHLSHRLTDRPIHAQTLLNYLKGLGDQARPQLLMGDLNEDDSQPWIRELAQLYADADAGLARKTFPADDPGLRIDYLWTSCGRWQNTTLIEANRDASDHLPLVADLVFFR